MTCRDCFYWERKQAMDKAGRIRKDRVARCLVHVPLPKSSSDRIVALMYMGPENGDGCVFHTPREQEK